MLLSKQHPLNARVERGRQSGFEKGCSQRSAAPLAQVCFGACLCGRVEKSSRCVLFSYFICVLTYD